MSTKMKPDLFLEKAWPYCVGIALTAAIYFTPAKSIVMRAEKDLSGSVVTIVSILIAFVATSMAIVLAGGDIPGLKRLHKYVGAYKSFIGYHTVTIWCGLICCILSLVEICLQPSQPNRYHNVFFAVWCASFVVTILCFIRVVNLFHSFLTEEG